MGILRKKVREQEERIVFHNDNDERVLYYGHDSNEVTFEGDIKIGATTKESDTTVDIYRKKIMLHD